MKVCPKCRKSYPDAQNFCSDCGVQLSMDTASSVNTRTPEIIHVPKQYPGWLCILMGMAGVFVGWEWSALLGFALAFVGASLGSKSGNALVKWSSYFLCGITILFVILVEVLD